MPVDVMERVGSPHEAHLVQTKKSTRRQDNSYQQASYNFQCTGHSAPHLHAS
ncbi:hypothetical protein COFA105466_09090 [Corynebacterium falsenii]